MFITENHSVSVCHNTFPLPKRSVIIFAFHCCLCSLVIYKEGVDTNQLNLLLALHNITFQDWKRMWTFQNPQTFYQFFCLYLLLMRICKTLALFLE